MLAAALLSGCSGDFVDSDQPRVLDGASLPAGSSLGQTFVTQHSGLAGVEVYLLADGSCRQGNLILLLKESPNAAEALATAQLPLAEVTAPGFYRFALANASADQAASRFALLSADVTCASLRVGMGPTGGYLNGSAYLDGAPIERQLSFRLVYGLPRLLLGMSTGTAADLGWLVLGALLYVLPGWALLSAAGLSRRRSIGERAALGAGLSLALYPLLLLWTHLAGLALGALYTILALAIALAYLAWHNLALLPALPARAQRWWRSPGRSPDLALASVVLLLFLARLVSVRSVPVPSWGDSYQHTMATQLFIDNKGLFDSWQPYVPLRSFTYHFGFQAAAALYHWLSGLSVIRSVIVAGQLINGLAALALYPLGLRLSGSRWGGVLAVLAAGLLSPMPMYYVNWGRYVQLAGQAILPVAAWLTWEAVEARSRRPWLWLVAALAVAGLGLTHYRVTMYYGIFVAVLLAVIATGARRRGLTQLFRAVLKLGLIAAAVSLLVAPWIWHLRSGLLPGIVGGFARSQAAKPAPQQLRDFANLTFFVPVGFLAATAAAAVWGLLRRRWQPFAVLAWVALAIVAAHPNWLGLPGASTISNFDGVLDNFTVMISLYMPASLLFGYLGAQALRVLPRRPACLHSSAPLVVTLLLALAGTRNALAVINPDYVLVTYPDLQAMRWIEANTPPDARFLANHFFAYEGHVIVGSDAGWWLPLLAGRANTVPPITYGHEAADDPSYIERVNGLAHFLEGHTLDDPAAVAELRRQGITYVYIGQKGGSLSPEVMAASPAYRLLYHRDQVWVFGLQ